MSKATALIKARSICPGIIAAIYYKPPHGPAMHGWFFRESQFIYSLLSMGILISEILQWAFKLNPRFGDVL